MKEKLLVKNFKTIGGKHCQTTALLHLLNHRDLKLSEWLSSLPSFSLLPHLYHWSAAFLVLCLYFVAIDLVVFPVIC